MTVRGHLLQSGNSNFQGSPDVRRCSALWGKHPPLRGGRRRTAALSWPDLEICAFALSIDAEDLESAQGRAEACLSVCTAMLRQVLRHQGSGSWAGYRFGSTCSKQDDFKEVFTIGCGLRRMSTMQRTTPSPTPRPINLVLDWDGTITIKDTMLAFGTMAQNRDVRLGKKPTGTDMFAEFGKAWMDDYSKHEQSYIPKPVDRKTIAEESAWLKSLSDVEARSAERVERSGFFTGLNRDDVQSASKSLVHSGQVALRPGWEELFLQDQSALINEDNPRFANNISILSVNWSEAFIRATLKNAVWFHNLDKELHKTFNELDIAANEINGLMSPDGNSGRLIDPSRAVIRTSFDKLQNFTYRKDHFNIYVGDSTTDLDCLVAADLGICIRDDPMSSSSKALAETLARLGYEVPYVSSLAMSDEEASSSTNLCWAESFDEILINLGMLEQKSRASSKAT